MATSASTRSFAALSAFAQLAMVYSQVRNERPQLPAAKAWNAVKTAETIGCSIDEALCPGHHWGYTGTEYGGDDEGWHGEGRCYCLNCGADGDA